MPKGAFKPKEARPKKEPPPQRYRSERSERSLTDICRPRHASENGGGAERSHQREKLGGKHATPVSSRSKGLGGTRVEKMQKPSTGSKREKHSSGLLPESLPGPRRRKVKTRRSGSGGGER